MIILGASKDGVSVRGKMKRKSINNPSVYADLPNRSYYL